MKRPTLAFVVESGTDVRLVDGLAEHFVLTVLARTIPGGRAINWPPASDAQVVTGPAGRLAFARWAAAEVRRRAMERTLVQGYGLAALAVNEAVGGAIMLVCSPIERYYRARRAARMPGMPYRPWELLAIQLVARANARLGARYVVLSEHLAEVVAAHGRLPAHVVPVYGVDTARFTPVTARERTALRAHLGLPADRPVIFFSSRIAPEKDAPTLLAACRALVDAGRPFTLLHLSGGWRAFAAEAHAAGLGDHLIARDAVHPARELPSWYQASDLCVQASREEGLGFSALEALACGIPVVASAVGGLTETVRDGDTGWTYAAGNVPGLERALAEALDDPREAARRAGRGRAMVERHYAARRVFADFAALVNGTVA